MPPTAGRVRNTREHPQQVGQWDPGQSLDCCGPSAPTCQEDKPTKPAQCPQHLDALTVLLPMDWQGGTSRPPALPLSAL